MSFHQYLQKVVDRESLSPTEARDAMNAILRGEVSPAQIAALLVGLRMKGETPEEMLGFAQAMRGQATRVHVETGGEPLLDTCGTGGDGSRTFNISTVAAFVVAGAGVRVAKHGNRSISSHCGSADIMEGLGVVIGAPPERVAAAIRAVGIGFLFAPAIHPAMRHAQPVRRDLRLRTAFNLLGPLTNPAGADVQMVGAPSEWAAELLARTLAALGLRSGYVAHGSDGLDEITTTGQTTLWEVHPGQVTRHVVHPGDFGVPVARLEDLRGADREANVEIARAILQGARGPHRDIVLVNAAAALRAAGAAGDFPGAMKLAAQSVDSGAAWAKVEALSGWK